MKGAAPGAPKRSALVQQVIEILQHDIASGRWPVGSRLPLEADLLNEHGVSRVTLRQAVQALVHVGALETIQGSGTFVRASNEPDAVLARSLSGNHLSYLLEARLAIETEAAELAAVRATPEDLEILSTALSESRTAAERSDLDALAPLSARFHHSIVVAAHNPVLTHLYCAIESGTEHSVREGSSHQPLTYFVHEHTEILDAITRGDASAALATARAHLTAVLHEHPRQSDDP